MSADCVGLRRRSVDIRAPCLWSREPAGRPRAPDRMSLSVPLQVPEEVLDLRRLHRREHLAELRERRSVRGILADVLKQERLARPPVETPSTRVLPTPSDEIVEPA